MRGFALLASLLPTAAWAARAAQAWPTQALVSQSRAWSGLVRLQNVGTGDSLAGDGLSLAPMDVSEGDIVRMTAHGNHVVLETAHNFCLSAQWHQDLGADWAAVLYSCIGSRKSSLGGIQPKKQQWLLIPASAAAAPGNGKKSGKKAGKGRGGGRLAKRDLVERGSAVKQGQAYYIVATDHLHDRAPRALGSAIVRTGDEGNHSIQLQPFQKGNSKQMWYITAVPGARRPQSIN